MNVRPVLRSAGSASAHVFRRQRKCHSPRACWEKPGVGRVSLLLSSQQIKAKRQYTSALHSVPYSPTGGSRSPPRVFRFTVYRTTADLTNRNTERPRQTHHKGPGPSQHASVGLPGPPPALDRWSGRPRKPGRRRGLTHRKENGSGRRCQRKRVCLSRAELQQVCDQPHASLHTGPLYDIGQNASHSSQTPPDAGSEH
ncbi:hypothetical protein Q8A67_019090 [Cirrhinus molitorella]|uniref:Uncharacterized protein n=1 Tax=Cirrhinus molitorella TaxID=172907 RepID=A0AA88PDB2_9TELE|nr:hypothetical protein Q8A67_019090 [Cirrhinus molitorella]